MRLLIILSVLFLFACDQTSAKSSRYLYEYGRYIPIEKKSEAAKFVSELVKNANPHSDEEPEDYIREANKTALRLFGIRTIGMRATGDNFLYFTPYHILSPEFKKQCLEQMGIEDGSQFELKEKKND